MLHLRRSVWHCDRPEGNRTAVGLTGEETFGDYGPFQSHSPRPAGRANPFEEEPLVPFAAPRARCNELR